MTAVNFPKFTTKDHSILLGTMLPMTVVMNSFLFGSRYFTDPGLLFSATALTFPILALSYVGYGMIAILLRNRFPSEEQTTRRLGISIAIFLVLSLVLLSLVLRGYESVHFYGYQFSENDFYKCYTAFAIMNVFLTFLNEGISQFEKYKHTKTETEQLKTEYMQSQLLGLKSQMNPHFLFNSLNTLSCLIQEDPDKAEEFLDEMSKVYRYLLRNNEEQLVTLQTELGFIESYFKLLRARYGEAIQMEIDIAPEYLSHFIPPLTLQMIVEHALNNNSVSKSNPLYMRITTNESGWLEIRNNIQEKINCELSEAVMDNIVKKYRLLCQKEVSFEQTDTFRTIKFPVFPDKENCTAC